ncbi:MAG: choline/carnitine O-acyltransferase [Neisseria sp.]|nr:choline/carnitine O-acyltransferase [Neisseria sp.]
MKPPRLPVPSLDGTLTRYLSHIRPLLDDAAYAEAEAAAHRFWQQQAPAFQTALQARADERPESSWLIDTWLDSYLAIRAPLPLASNVGFGIPMHGADLAQWCAAVAAVCADWLHGRIETPVSPQGAPVSMEQWRILEGAARIPETGRDGYRFAENARHIGVLHNGWYYRIAALNEQGEALPAAHFRAALAQISADKERNPYPFALASLIGGDEGAQLYRQLCSQADNARLADDIADDLFHVSLIDEHLDDDADLATAAFLPDCGAWAYKPMTFRYNTATQKLFLHVEHTWPDGGALKGIIAHAAAKLAETADESANTLPAPERRSWQLDSVQQQNWPLWQQQYAGQARQMRVHSLTVPFDGISIPKGISQDALMQFALQYAQLVAFGRIRNTYEAVDTSHFLRGRTECVRPVSAESVSFVRKLSDGRADAEIFAAALAEHKARIKAAKMGLGANRHLLGLHVEARAAGADTAWFDSEAYRIFTTDFLSTSTVGDDALVRNFAFAPTSKGGFGVNYTLTAAGWLFTLSFHEAQTKEAVHFADALAEGAEKILRFAAAAG